MGITSSTHPKTEDSELKSRIESIKQNPPEKLRAYAEAAADAGLELVSRELYALFPPKLGDSSTDQPKEGDTDRDEEIELRLSEYMKEGGCKESFMVLKDCVDEAKISPKKCNEFFPTLKKCMDAHSDYYQPILTLLKTTDEFIEKQAKDFAFSEREAAGAAANKQAEGGD